MARYKKELLETVEHTRRIMSDLGETNYAVKLVEDYKSIEQEMCGKKLPKAIDRAIDENCFWELIEAAKQGSQSIPEQMDLLLMALETFKAAEIKRFRLILDAQMDALLHWDVWALAYLAMRYAGGAVPPPSNCLEGVGRRDVGTVSSASPMGSSRR